MSGRRCPSCGGLVAVDAEWCGQCLARLTPPREEADPLEATQGIQPADGREPGEPEEGANAEASRVVGIGGIRARGKAFFWDCPACGTENPLEARACSACGTPFRQLVAEPETPPEVDPQRASRWSLVFPGAGHVMAGRRAEGFARAIEFAFALTIGVSSLLAFRRGGSGAFLLLMVLGYGAAAVVYVTSSLDAGRAAEGKEPILPTRVLLYGMVGLILITMIVATLAASGARTAAGSG